jgi:hypothetical protein
MHYENVQKLGLYDLVGETQWENVGAQFIAPDVLLGESQCKIVGAQFIAPTNHLEGRRTRHAPTTPHMSASQAHKNSTF